MTTAKNIRSWLTILLLTGLGISVSPHRILTRTAEVSRALSPVLSSYEVIHVEPGEIERQVRTTGELRFRFNETDFYFNLEPHNMRAPNYLAVETGPGGVRRILPPQPVHTFKGVLAGREHTRARFNLTAAGVEGVIYAPEGRYYVEPLQNYLPSASDGELVVYRHADIKTGEALRCGVSLPKRLQRGVEQVTAQVEAGTSTKYELDVATEADYEYVQALGGSENARREIEGILNQVDGVYESELLLKLRISFQHIWDMEDDPYTATNAFDLVDEFKAYWNANHAANHDYDLAHLWTENNKGAPGGVAHQSVVCSDRTQSYSVSQRQVNYIDKHHLPAHEIGHVLGGTHPHETLPRERSASLDNCSTSIMWIGTVGGSGLTFCKSSREEISSYVSSNNGCLTPVPINFQPPTDLEITTSSFSQASFSRIDLSWQDNSTNETGFIVQRRRVGWGFWAEIERTTANVTTFSESGLFPGTTYVYRVQAYNGDEISAFSNEVEAETIAGPLSEAHWKINTIAGTGEIDHRNALTFEDTLGSYSGDGGPAVQAHLNFPSGVAVDDSGNIYIADTWNQRIRRVDTSGIITTIAGTGEFKESPTFYEGRIGGYSGDGGPAVGARLNFPRAVAVDGSGNLYIADDGNHLIRRVDTGGIITTIAGTGEGTGEERYYQGGYSGDGGAAVEARLYGPIDLAVDGAGNLYIADSSNHCIRRVDASGIITTVAGVGNSGYSGDGGPAVDAQLRFPNGIDVDEAGNLYIADSGNDRIRQVDASGIITTIAGVGIGRLNRRDGPASLAAMDRVGDVAVDSAGNLYIADTGNQHIRRVDTRGIITTIAGTTNILGYAAVGYNWDSGPAFEVRLAEPFGIAADKSGKVYIADTMNHRIRVLTRPPRPLVAPTHLKATTISFQKINLSWQDNSDGEEGFRVQRRVDGSSAWIDIGTTDANVTTYSDTGLEPTTIYNYRVRAYRQDVTSDFSNEAQATTPKVYAPTLTRIAPTRGPVGTRVTITGTHFLGATAVKFNAIPAVRFEVVSGSRIEGVVPPDFTSGPVSVVTPGGTAVSTEAFTVTDTGIHSRLFVPIVLRNQGRTPGSLFTSELILTNQGSTTAAVHYTYTAAFGGGSGTAVDVLEAGRQRVIPDAIAYLTSLGVPIESGSVGGTLVVDFSNLSLPSDAAVTVRVATPVEEGNGRAGLAFPGLHPDGLLTGPAFITGLRQNRQDRSNLAVQNAGVGGEKSITLRVTVFSGDPASGGRSVDLPDLSLPPGGFHQYNGILTEAGFDNGYVKVEPVAGTAPYYAYGVINDNFNSDGSFVFPVIEFSLVGTTGQTLPVIIETGNFQSELILTNFSASEKTVDFSFVAEAVETGDDTATFSLELKAGEQRILPNIVEELRQQEATGIGRANRAFVGALFATVAEGDMSGILIGARTGAPDQRGGQYGLFYNGVPYGSASTESAWIYGLQQNKENRSNLALVNTGEIDDSSSTFEITIYDGSGERQPRTRSVTLGPRRWTQENGILGSIRQGYVQVRKTSGDNPFVTYGVVNDGGRPGERSGDGALLPAQE